MVKVRGKSRVLFYFPAADQFSSAQLSPVRPYLVIDTGRYIDSV